MDPRFLNPYKPEETEQRIYQLWLESGFFNPDNLPDAANRPPFTIVMPPPNANGNLHAGHALFITLEDIMTRFARMQGKRALWIPGADHAGFETQVVYEKKLEKEGRSRFGMDPKQLYDEIYAFTLENKKNMEAQVRTLGASCDWSREKFTLDPEVVQKVQETFVKMYDDQLVYRGKRIINWCPKHQTSLSDVETETVEETGKLYYFIYGPFEIATARPETKFGDKYVVMHPDDKRYAKWKHGEKLTVEWINGPIEATIIKDAVIDMSFGTGVMTITPWHSAVDFELAQKYELDAEQIIDWRGKLLPIANELAGMKITDAREKIVEKLAQKGLVTKIEENYKHVVKRCYKCNTMIEPQVKDQWFVKMKPLGEMALASVDRGEIRFIPDNFEKIFRYWMENTLDWNISRQIVWGIPIPAWLCDTCGTHKAALGTTPPSCDQCHQTMRKESDTFDTWFSSGQWPLLVTDYPNGKDYKTYYPTDVMETGHDLIFKWVPRMVIFGLYLGKRAPFHTVYLHGLVNDAQGKKMSKSKGNVVNPLDLTAKYGTDALRMGLVVGNTPGSDLALREDKIKAYKLFANKLWNITRFVFSTTEGVSFSSDSVLTAHDQTILDELDTTTKDITADMENYRFYMAGEKIYHYVWNTFADKIIEENKERLFENEDAADKASAQLLLMRILERSLVLLHPFMPFITEEIWGTLPNRPHPLIVAPWPSVK
jgi:valyl-tRNA synthetase